MAIETLYPAIRPSLNLDFANTKALDPRVTFYRASAAAYYDGKTVAKAEENLFTSSDGPLQTVHSGAVYNGDGTISFSAATNSSFKVTEKFTAVGTQFTVSVLLSGSGTVRFGALSGSGGALTTYTTISLTGTPTRYSFTVVNTVSGSNCGFQLVGAADDSAATVKIEKYQFELRGQATAYTPTTSQPITNYIPVLQTAPAGVPRFDHNPVTGESLGLLVEEQRTNLLLRSQALNEIVSWGATGALIETVTVAPDGTLSAYKLVEKSTNTTHYVYQNYFSTSGASDYTFSVYVKAAGRNRVQLWTSTGAPRFNAVFDLENFTYIPLPDEGPSTLTSARITPVANGWCRISITGKVGLDNTAMQVTALLDNGISHVYPGDNYSGIYIWGAQLEAGAFPTSYIKTEASQVTRAEDLASLTGANFSSWYRQDEGTLFAESAALGYSPNDRYLYLFSKEGTSSADSIHSRTFTDQLVYSIYAGSTVQAYFHIAVMPAYVFSRLAFAYKPDSTNFAINSQIGTSDTQSTIPNITRLEILGNACRHYRRLTYYPKRLSDAQLQSLTT